MKTNFIESNQKDIALMFQDYGFDAPVSQRTVLQAMEKFGTPFVEDFALLAEIKNTNFDGQSKKMSSEQIASIVSGVLGVGSTVASAFGTQPTAPAAAETEDKTKRDAEKEKDNKNLYIIGGAVALILVLVVVALFISKK